MFINQMNRLLEKFKRQHAFRTGKRNVSSPSKKHQQQTSNSYDKDIKLAAKNGNLDGIIKTSYFCSPEALSKALYEACCYNRFEIVKWFMTNFNWKVDICCLCRKKRSPLSIACDKGYIDIVELLIKHGQTTKINISNSDGFTPLIIACHNGHVAVAKLLTELPTVNINLANTKGDTALHYVIWCVKEFWTPLHKACDKKDIIQIENIIKASNDDKKAINAQDNKGNSPLHYACKRGHQETIELLMVFGADDTITNDKHMTPAQVCEENNRKDLIELLDMQQALSIIERRQRLKKLNILFNKTIASVRMLLVLMHNRKEIQRKWKILSIVQIVVNYLHDNKVLSKRQRLH